MIVENIVIYVIGLWFVLVIILGLFGSYILVHSEYKKKDEGIFSALFKNNKSNDDVNKQMDLEKKGDKNEN